MDILHWFMMFGCSIIILHFSWWQRRLVFWIGYLSLKIEIPSTTLLSLQRTAVMFKDTSVTTSDNPRFSLLIFIISCNGVFSIRFAHTIPVVASGIALKCLSKVGLVKWKLKLKLKSKIKKFTIKIYESTIHRNISKYIQSIVYDNS